jgi:hypothetical protein
VDTQREIGERIVGIVQTYVDRPQEAVSAGAR